MSESEPPDVAPQVRALRKRRGLSMRALAEMCDLSPNTISLIERGATLPNVATLHRLAMALGVPITAFFEERQEKARVLLTRADERPRTGTASVLLESIGSGLPDQTLEPFVVTLRPTACGDDQVMAHEGHELVFCLSGRVEYEVAGQTYDLGVGDALLFEAKLPHRWCNPTTEPALFLLVFETAVREESVSQHLQG